jgi:hypothetical protein
MAHLECYGPQIIFPVVQVIHCAAVFVGEGVEEETFDDATLANPCASQNDQSDSFVITHAAVCKPLSYLQTRDYCAVKEPGNMSVAMLLS